MNGVYEIVRHTYIRGKIKDFSLDSLGAILIIAEDTEKSINRLFRVLENGRVLSENVLKLRFKIGDDILIVDGGIVKFY